MTTPIGRFLQPHVMISLKGCGPGECNHVSDNDDSVHYCRSFFRTCGLKSPVGCRYFFACPGGVGKAVGLGEERRDSYVHNALCMSSSMACRCIRLNLFNFYGMSPSICHLNIPSTIQIVNSKRESDTLILF
jgi:hypothetical protein